MENAGFVDASMGAADAGDLLIPPDAFVRLVMGFRGIEELRDAWPELHVRPAAAELVDALFPGCRRGCTCRIEEADGGSPAAARPEAAKPNFRKSSSLAGTAP